MSEERVGGERAGQEVVEEQGGDVVSHHVAGVFIIVVVGVTNPSGRLISILISMVDRLVAVDR